MIEQQVLEFIKRRFAIDCNWKTNNCYFFAVILKSRFPKGIILYDVIDGHFVLEIQGKKYDWTGIVSEEGKHVYVKWDDFDDYDIVQKQRIINDCTL